MSDEETRRTIELQQFFSVLPAFRGIYHDIDYSYPTTVTTTVTDPYIAEIKAFLKNNKLLQEPEESTEKRYWPGDKEEKVEIDHDS